MSPLLLTILTFLAAVLGVFAVYSLLSDLFLRDRSRVSRRVDDEFRKRQRDQIRGSALFKRDLVPGLAESAAEERKLSWRQRFNFMIEQSGLNLRPERLMFLMTLGGIICGLLGAIVGQSALGASVGIVAGTNIPLFYVMYKRKARLDRMLKQLPDAFDLMGRVIRAGQTMSQAMQAVADAFDQPLAGEFTYCVEQQNLGLSPEESLRDLARRTGLLEIKIFVLAMLVQQQTGGNLAEILDKLSHLVRERFRMQGKIKALTAEGRFQAMILLIIPIAIMIFMTCANKAYSASLFKHPWIIVSMLVSEGLGALWIRRIVNFDH